MKTPRFHCLRQTAHRGLALLAFASLTLLPARATLNGTFTVTGDPRTPGLTGGATWTYVSADDDGVQYNLKGALFAPESTYGFGPFPAVVINHGNGETAEKNGTNNQGAVNIAAAGTADWVHAGPSGSQGVVCIGVNLAHAVFHVNASGQQDNSTFKPGNGINGPTPQGADVGASTANVQRIHKVRELLGSHPYFNPVTGTVRVDATRVAIHGHSMGAFATGAAAGVNPTDFIVASHTAGGESATWSIATQHVQANAITIPYQRHHGDADTTVPLSNDQTLSSTLNANGVPNELRVYPGIGHASSFAADGDGLDSWGDIELWWAEHGMFPAGGDTTPPGDVTGLAATPGNAQVQLSWTNPGDSDLTGIRVLRKTGSYPTSPTDGIVVQDALNTGLTDTGLTNGTTYFYKVFAHDAVPNYAAGAQVSATPSGSSSLTVYSQAANDGWILESSETSNLGGSNNSTLSAADSLRMGDDSTKKQYRSIVSFDTSALPDGAIIDSVTIRLTRGTVVGNNTNMAGFGNLNVAIKGGAGFGGAVTLANGDFSTTSGAAPDLANIVSGGMAVPTTNGGQTTGTLISGALTYVNKTGTTQFRIDFGTDDDNDASTDYVGFYSGENATLTNKPQLVITYH